MWRGRRVLVTGHTGFKGGWLSLWLHHLGAEVHGLALPPVDRPNLFEVARIEGVMATHTIADIRDFDAVRRTVAAVRPEVVLHLAAQPLVRHSYTNPVETYATNVMGVVHLLEAVRAQPATKVLVNVTTDKCYENHERDVGYREHEAMGGHDPYSSSKGCSELVTAAYRRSFLADAGIATATARAGNVIGGGDWSADRLVPDVLRALDAGKTLTVRYPDAVRPWQHVLEPLSGYLRLAQALWEGQPGAADAWNFGPADDSAQTVRWILDFLLSRRSDLRWRADGADKPHEAGLLRLDSTKAHTRLGWAPRWSVAQALERTLAWHQAWRRADDMRAFTLAQIDAYSLERSRVAV